MNSIRTFFLLIMSAILLNGALGQHTADHKHNAQHDSEQTQSTFEDREVEVMPFDLTKTLHIFTDTIYGGKQDVINLDTNDSEQVYLIREHLKMEAQRFTKGDFGDPSYLHGEDMAGLSDISQAAKSGSLTVEYQDIPDGATIHYSSDDPWVIIALHLWFQAQIIDHGDHATSNQP